MRPRATGVFFFVPARFDAAGMPALAGLEDFAHWLLDRIVRLSCAYRHGRGADAGGEGWACLSYHYIAEHVHRDRVGTIKRTLIEAGVVECDGCYLPAAVDPTGKGKSLGYRIAAAYRVGGIRRVECGRDALADKARRGRAATNRPANHAHLAAVHSYLLNRLGELDIDRALAHRIIDGMPTEAEAGDLMGDTWAQSTARLTTDAIATKDIDWAVCPYGRFHSPVTRLPTEIRPCLSFGGESLANVDIRNSQLVFLCLFLNLVRQPRARSSSLDFIGVRGSGGGLAGRPDVGRFVGLVLGGGLYDGLMRMIGTFDRRQFKAKFFGEILYCDDRKPYVRRSDLRRAFRDEFPTVDAMIGNAKRDNYRHLARKMQTAESAFMLGGVCERLRVTIPDLPVATIHDSILAPGSRADDVRAVMLAEFRRLGIEPAIAIQREAA